MNMVRTTLLVTLLLTVVNTALSCETNNGEGGISSIGEMTTRRAAHTATLLQNGKVLVAGGFAGGSSLSTVELFDPATKSFTAAPNMSVARAGHTATLLSNGRVLIAGGYNGSYVASAELYDPAANSFTPASAMTAARSGHVATPLPNGKVLLIGGVGTGWTFLASAEIYDPAANIFSATGAMLAARESHTATLLANGKVLVAGGHRGRRPTVTIYSSAEIYDTATGKFTAAGDMTTRRHKHDAVPLADGRILILGGSDERDGDGAYASAEIYDPARNTFTATASMNSPRYKLQGTAVLLSTGKVLVAGGADRAEIFDPFRNTFTYVAGDMQTARLFATATRLRDGQVLILGGYNIGNVVSAKAWITSLPQT
jgi:hypothetical protein